MAKTIKSIKKKPVSNAKIQTAVKKNDKRVFIYAILIAILTVIVFSNSLRNKFVNNFDDIIYTTAADSAKALSANDLGEIFTDYVGGNYHPMTILSFAVETSLYGQSAFHYHFFNLLFHVLNVLLVFSFIYLLSKRVEISVIVALFFGIHPMHVESVSWISERKDVLYTFFFLGSLITYLRYIQNTKKYKYIIFSVILFLFSLLSKSAAVCLAPIVVLIDFYRNRNFGKKVILEKVPYFLLALLFGIIALLSQSSAGATGAMNEYYQDYSIVERIFLISYAIMFYIIKVIIPLSLSVIHYYPAKAGETLPVLYYLSPLGISIIVYLIYRLKKIRQDLLFGFLFFFASIILVLQFIPVGYAIVAERYTYVPYIGLFFIAGKLYSDFTDNKFGNFTKTRKNLLLLIFAVIAIVFSFMSYERNKIWKNDVAVFDDVIAKYPEVGHCYWARGNSRISKNDIKGALSDYNKAIENYYDYAVAYDGRASCYFKMDSFDLAIAGYTEAIKKDSNFALAYYNRAHAKQKIADFEGSIKDYKKAIEKNITNIGFVYNEMSFSQFSLNDYENALASVNEAIRYDTGSANLYLVNKAKIEFLLKKYDASLADYNKAIEGNTEFNLTYYNRALLKIAMGDTSGACIDFNQASALGNENAKLMMQVYCK